MLGEQAAAAGVALVDAVLLGVGAAVGVIEIPAEGEVVRPFPLSGSLFDEADRISVDLDLGWAVPGVVCWVAARHAEYGPGRTRGLREWRGAFPVSARLLATPPTSSIRSARSCAATFRTQVEWLEER